MWWRDSGQRGGERAAKSARGPANPAAGRRSAWRAPFGRWRRLRPEPQETVHLCTFSPRHLSISAPVRVLEIAVAPLLTSVLAASRSLAGWIGRTLSPRESPRPGQAAAATAAGLEWGRRRAVRPPCQGLARCRGPARSQLRAGNGGRPSKATANLTRFPYFPVHLYNVVVPSVGPYFDRS